MNAVSSSQPRSRRWWLSLLLWVLAPILILWTLRSASLSGLWLSLAQLSILQLVALLAANLLVVLIFSGRWWVVLRALGYRLPYLTVAGYRLAASGMSYFTPGPHVGGEPLQIVLLNRRTGISTADAATSVGLERTLEMLVNFAFLAAGVGLTIRGQLFDARLGSSAVIVASGLMLLPVGLLTLLWSGQRPLSRLLEWLLGAVRTRKKVRLFQESLRHGEEQAGRLLRDRPGYVLMALGFSLLSWAGIIGEYWLVTHLMGLTLTPIQLISILTVARVAFLSPLPGGIGTLEAGQMLIFQLVGLDPVAGLALSFLIRARDVLFSGAGLWLGGLWLVDPPA